MLSKPFNFALVYIVTTINMVVLALPIVLLAAPFMSFEGNVVTMDYGIYMKMKFVLSILAFTVSFLMLLYLFLDFIFGFSLRASMKQCTRYEKIKDYDFLTDLFDQVKNKFGQKNVKLYIKDSAEINAFAVSSMRGRAIVLTKGLINHYLVQCDDPKMFLYALRSVIGHEMSHLVNKDFLPTFLIITNQKITNLTSTILHVIFAFASRAIRMIPMGSWSFSRLILDCYSILNFILTSFNRFVVYNVYDFLRRFVSRSVEYRCDRQSAKAFGGKNMALALSMMGKSGYFTLFSTHPATNKRIKRVKGIKIQDSVVHPGFSDILSNYFSLMMLVVICLYFAKQAHVDYMVREYVKNHEAINSKVSYLWQLISKFF
jgi:Zn-dependent protease with chaperone function